MVAAAAKEQWLWWQVQQNFWSWKSRYFYFSSSFGRIGLI